MRYHIGSNIPGYLPEGDVYCVDNINEAVSLLRYDAKDASDQSFDAHYAGCVRSESDADKSCDCEDYQAYINAEALKSHIADGDSAWHVENRGGIVWTIGRIVYWISRDAGCEGCADEAA